MRTLAKFTLVVLATLLIISLVLVFVVAHYTVVFMLDGDVANGVLPSNLSANDPSTGEPSPYREWMLLASRQYLLLSEEDLLLNGYYIPAPKESHRYVILCHGYKNSAPSMATYAHVYHNAGWNVLAPDHRAHGYSEGQYIGMGLYEHQDLLEWINLLVKQDSKAQILLHGVSMGAATVMMATGSPELSPNVVAVIEDCGYSSVSKELTDKIFRVAGLPAFPWIPVTSLMTKLKAGYFLGDVDCVAAVAKSTTPILFIHGTEDKFVPFWMLEEVYAAATCPKIKLEVAGAAHAQSQSVNPELYWSTIHSFVNRFVPPY